MGSAASKATRICLGHDIGAGVEKAMALCVLEWSRSCNYISVCAENAAK